MSLSSFTRTRIKNVSGSSKFLCFIGISGITLENDGVYEGFGTPIDWARDGALGGDIETRYKQYQELIESGDLVILQTPAAVIATDTSNDLDASFIADVVADAFEPVTVEDFVAASLTTAAPTTTTPP